MIKTSQKMNLSSLQVLKTLCMLFENNLTMQELVKKLNEIEQRPVFNNSIVSKYINTCRFCGINIPKINNKYCLAKMPFGFRLSQDDTEMLESLVGNLENSLTSKQVKTLNSLIEKINKFTDLEIQTVGKESYVISLEMFERAVTDKRKIKLIFKNRANMEGIPLNIVESNGKTFFNILCKNKERTIDISRVSGIQVLSEKYLPFTTNQSVIFELRGKLAKRYQARENETASPDSLRNVLVVSNRGENKNVLLSRLLRYDDLCEIKSPKQYREEMQQIINDTLANYGEE